MSRDIAPFGVRMQPELKQKIEIAAKTNGRSMNAEIVHRLEQSFSTEPITSNGKVTAAYYLQKASELLYQEGCEAEAQMVAEPSSDYRHKE